MRSMSVFGERLQGPYERIAQWKEKNKKSVVGCVPMYFPEEIIHASGAMPIVIQDSNELITLGSGHMDTFFCRFVRVAVDHMAKGMLSFLDLMLVPDTCVQQRGMAQTLKHMQSSIPIELVQFPIRIGEQGAIDRAIQCLERVMTRLEQLTGNTVSDEQLMKSMQVYEENRSLLGRVNRVRRERPGLLRARHMIEIVQASMVMPKEEHTAHLKTLFGQLKEAQAPANEGIRLCVSGHFCSAPPLELLDLIEEMGATIVDDDLYTGRRYFDERVDKKGGPKDQLARRFVYRNIPTPTRYDPENDWRDYLVNMVRDAGAQGLILLISKHCDPLLIWYPDVRDALSEAGIPCLMIETNHDNFSLAVEKTRIRKLVEIIGEGMPAS